MNIDDFRARHAEARITLSGQEWSVIDTGATAPAQGTLVMIPGAFGAAEIFWNQMLALTGQVRVVSVTLPPVTEVAALGEGLATLAQSLGIARANWLGSSMGGYLVQWLAVRRPELIDTLFVSSSLIGAQDLALPPDPAQVAARTGAELRQAILAGIDGWPETRPEYAALKRFLHEHGDRCLSDDMIKARTLMLATLPDLPELTFPRARAVMLDCEDDPMISAAGRARVRERYLGAEQWRFPWGGHFPYLTRPHEYSEALRQRLARRPR